MRFKCVIFDLDGTLVDTIADIAEAMNHTLAGHGFPPVPTEDYKDFVGRGIRNLARLALPAAAREDRIIDAVTQDAIRRYAARPLVHSRPYGGIPEVVAELKRRKIKTAVLTNKPDPVAQLVVGGLFPPDAFNYVTGEKPGRPRKPDPASTWEILMKLDCTPRETIFMGDSEVDMETARRADCHALGVSWGFRARPVLEKAGADRIIDRPEELLGLIDIRI
jgi:phosphoglycolate phosphatase